MPSGGDKLDSSPDVAAFADFRHSRAFGSLLNQGSGRVARPFGFALTDPGVRISRTRLFSKVTQGEQAGISGRVGFEVEELADVARSHRRQATQRPLTSSPKCSVRDPTHLVVERAQCSMVARQPEVPVVTEQNGGNTGTRYSFRAECSASPVAAAPEISIVSPYFRLRPRSKRGSWAFAWCAPARNFLLESSGTAPVDDVVFEKVS